MFYSILSLLRIKDWLKNIIIFIPIIVSGQLSELNNYSNLSLAFIIFCISASFIYIVNDITDINSDKKHPLKKNKKPLASEKLSLKFAYSLALLLLILILILLYFNLFLLYHLIAYILLNLTYNFLLKRIAIVDLLILSFGYIIRLDAGSHAIYVESSLLMISTIYSLVFFILSIKRMGEFKLGTKYRLSLAFYSKNLFYFLILSSAILFLVFFLFYALTFNNYLLPAFPIILFLLYRYFNIANNNNEAEFPIDLVFKDKILLFSSICFLIYLLILYY